jgi:hypothetical protein
MSQIGRVEPKEGLSCLPKSCYSLELSKEHFASILIGKSWPIRTGLQIPIDMAFSPG